MNSEQELELLIVKAKEVGALTERLRIIKLLADIAVVTPAGEVAVMELLSAIEALIKGEQI